MSRVVIDLSDGISFAFLELRCLKVDKGIYVGYYDAFGLTPGCEVRLSFSEREGIYETDPFT